MKEIKIFHIADMQYEIRVNGMGSQRFFEFNQVMNINCIEAIEKEQPDVIVIAGDVFEFESTNGEEQKLFTDFLHKAKNIKSVKRIIAVDGNHDVKQFSNGIFIGGETESQSTSIEAIIEAINDDKISYYKHTGVYQDTYYTDLKWAVWSQLDKHSPKNPKPNYSPFIDNEVPTGSFIEIYHDPISMCIGFDGTPTKTFEKYKVSLNDFKANTIIAGDIHKPQITWFGDNNQKLFTYCSSTVMRNFGEGDKYLDYKSTQFGNEYHGYNIIQYSIEENRALSCEFKKLQNPVHRHTIEISKDFVYNEENIKLLASNIEGRQSNFNKVRLVCCGNISDFIKHQELLYVIFNETINNVTIEFTHDENVINVDIDESTFTDLESVLDKDKILDISKTYIDSIVNSTTTIESDDKEEAKERIYGYLKDQLENNSLEQDTNVYKMVKAKGSNFMNFGDFELEFTEDKINVIQGTNGSGKTTIMHFTNWMFNNQISKSQTMKLKKYNNSLYFNNNSEDDVVYGEYHFYRNGVLHILEKQLVREWKKNKKDIKSKKILDLISDITETYKLTIGNNEPLSSKDSENYIKDLFNFESMNSITFINSKTINEMAEMDIEEMSLSFLKVMGLDISAMLESSFETFRETEMKKLAKPSMDISELDTKVQKLKEEQAINEVKYKESENNIQIDKLVVENIENDIENVRLKLHNVIEHSEYENKKLLYQTDLLNKNSEKENIEKEISEFKEVDINEINQNVQIKEIEIQNKYKESENLQTDRNTKTSELEKLKDEANTVRNNIIDEINANIKKLNSEISSNKEEIITINYGINNKQNEIKDIIGENTKKIDENILGIKNIVLNLNSNKMEYENNINNSKKDITNNNGFIENKEAEIEKLKNSKECITCGQPLKEESILEINKSIVLIQDSINLTLSNNKKLEDVINDNQSKLDETQKNISEELTKLKELEKNKSDILDGVIKITDARIDEIENTIKLNKSKIVEFQEIIDNKQKEIDSLESNKNETVKNNEKIKEYITLVLGKQEEIKVLDNKSETIKSEVTELNNQMSSLRIKHENAQKHNDKINELTNKKYEVNLNISNIQNKQLELENILPKINENIKNKEVIDNLKIKLKESQIKYEETQKSYYSYKMSLQKTNDDLEGLRTDIENLKQYKLTEASLKLYKRVIGKKGLPQYVFAHLVPLLNRKLNENLSDVDFRLLFDSETLELRYYSLIKDVTQPLIFTSGMERTIIGLLIAHIKRLLNHSNRFNLLFIDEISGTLNDGEDLSYEAKNYQNIVMKFLDKLSENVNIYIIDHTLQFNKARKIEIVPTPKGSTIVTK